MTLLGRVVFHLEGTETTARRNVSGEPVYIVQTFGFHRWIEEAADGHMTALDLLALVLYRRYFRADDARAVVHGWHEELRRAVEAGEVTPRDPSSLLPCRADFEGLGWLVSRADAARLLERHQTGIDLDATIAEMLEGARDEGEAHHHPETGEWMESRWLAGYGPKEGGHSPTAIEPVEWCQKLAEGWFAPDAQTPAAPASAPSASAPAVAVPEPVALPAEAVPSECVVRHTLKTRRNPLAAVFARAKQEATDSTCPHSVWAALSAMAQGSHPPPELTDFDDAKGIQATGARDGWLPKGAFMDRWRRGSV